MAAKGLIDGVRGHMKLRRRLMPYLYTTTWQASQTGAPPVRPLIWEDERDPRLALVDDAFLLANKVLEASTAQGGTGLG